MPVLKHKVFEEDLLEGIDPIHYSQEEHEKLALTLLNNKFVDKLAPIIINSSATNYTVSPFGGGNDVYEQEVIILTQDDSRSLRLLFVRLAELHNSDVNKYIAEMQKIIYREVKI